ncbi:MAG TPA: hypothetical protein VHE37_13470 [Nevskiaceae bacterium]|nr:hypothetical protein [Nevskiaceae bacterium]
MLRRSIVASLLASALCSLAACVSQSVGPNGVEQSVGPFHQSIGPSGVSQGMGSGGPSQNLGAGGVYQTTGSGGPSQSVSPSGVQQSSAAPQPPPKMSLSGMTVTLPGASSGSSCRATCAGKQYAIACPADQRATCQCSNVPYASCVTAQH